MSFACARPVTTALPCRRAFTLLEVIAAVLVGAVVLLALASSLRTAFTARDAAAALIADTAMQSAVTEQMRSDLQAIARPRGALTSGFIGADEMLSGSEADELLIRLAVPRRVVNRVENPGVNRSFGRLAVTEAQTQAFVGGDVVQVEYLLEQRDVLDDRGYATGDSTLALIRREHGNLLSPVELEPATRVLMSHVQSLHLAYYDGVEWLDGWEPTAEMPLPFAVRMTLTYGDNGDRVIAQVVRVPVAVAADSEEASQDADAPTGEGGRP